MINRLNVSVYEHAKYAFVHYITRPDAANPCISNRERCPIVVIATGPLIWNAAGRFLENEPPTVLS